MPCVTRMVTLTWRAARLDHLRQSRCAISAKPVLWRLLRPAPTRPIRNIGDRPELVRPIVLRYHIIQGDREFPRREVARHEKDLSRNPKARCLRPGDQTASPTSLTSRKFLFHFSFLGIRQALQRHAKCAAARRFIGGNQGAQSFARCDFFGSNRRAGRGIYYT
jgi:hypothetical protein